MRPPTSSKCLGTLFFGLAFVGTVLAYAPRAHAQQGSAGDIAQARELLNEGLELRRKGDNAGALGKLRAAHALARTPITGIELARAYVAVGKLVDAREAYLSIARIPERSEETAKSRAARAESAQSAEQLRARIPSLTVKISGVPLETVAVTIDGAAVPSEALAAPRFVDPGSHSVFARSTTGGTAETTVELKEGETREIELRIAFVGGVPTLAPPGSVEHEAPPLARESASPSPRSHALEWSLMGAGAAVAIAGGVLMGVEANQASNAANTGNRSSYDSAKTGWAVGIGGLVAGGAAIAVGGIVWAASGGAPAGQGRSASLWLNLGPGDVRLGGSW
jgi:hypothetical protein